MPLIMWLFSIPFLASIVIYCCFNLAEKYLKRLALVLSFLPLLLLIANHHNLIGEKVQYDWIPMLSIQFHLSIDALSALFIYLTAVVIPVSILSINSAGLPYPRTFYALIFFLQGLLTAFFAVRDLALFTVFWEAMLLPLYFIINIWGKSRRRQASLKFLIYMFAGSSLMVAAVLGLYLASGASTFNFEQLARTASGSPYALWIFVIFMLAFAVKTPLFPFHAWLPDAYYEAPVPGTILLSAILSKAGIFGFLRIGIGFFPNLMVEAGPLLLGLAIAGVFYGALNAWVQTDFKRLIAYSSLSHVNFILAGLFIWNQTAHTGAILQAINHGITIAALFLVAGWLEERLNTTAMNGFSGLTKYMPHLSWLTLVFVLSNVAVPGTNNFIGELLILFGLFVKNPWLAAILGLSIILSVIYMLRLMQKVYFDQPAPFQAGWVDIKAREMAIALPLAALVIWIGVYPAPLLKDIEAAAVNKMEIVE